MRIAKIISIISISIALVGCSAIPKKSPCGALNQDSAALAFTVDSCGELRAVNKS